MTTVAADIGYRANLVRHARAYVARGLALTPCLPRGKRPYLPAWGRNPLRTVEQIDAHWSEHPRDNVGLVLGPASGVCDLEDDSPVARELLARLLAPEDTRTPTYQSGKSLHRLFRLPVNATSLGNVLAVEGIELRLGLDGQSQSVLPPSIHPTGRIYTWLAGRGIWQVEPRPCPENVVEFIEERLAIRDERASAVPQARPAAVRLPDGDRPGDVFNATATWDDVLGPHGWRVWGRKGDRTLWQHPASESGGASGATGWRTAAGNDVLVVYSNRTPFKTVLQDHATYTKFEAFAVLNCAGDLREAARRLAREGYRAPEGRARRDVTYRVIPQEVDA